MDTSEYYARKDLYLRTVNEKGEPVLQKLMTVAPEAARDDAQGEERRS